MYCFGKQVQLTAGDEAVPSAAPGAQFPAGRTDVNGQQVFSSFKIVLSIHFEFFFTLVVMFSCTGGHAFAQQLDYAFA
jgi:hypothetical protein